MRLNCRRPARAKVAAADKQGYRFPGRVLPACRFTPSLPILEQSPVGKYQPGLPLTTRAPAALGVVGRSWRHIAHVHHVYIGDVNAQFHRDLLHLPNDATRGQCACPRCVSGEIPSRVWKPAPKRGTFRSTYSWLPTTTWQTSIADLID